jgi:hypothetical protein
MQLSIEAAQMVLEQEMPVDTAGEAGGFMHASTCQLL